MAHAPKIGLALAGGGPLGAIYEIGALCALEEAIPALNLNALQGYVGVSAGALVAAGLANGMTPRQMFHAFIENDGPAGDIVHPSVFVRLALGEYTRRIARLPGLLAQAAYGLVAQRHSGWVVLEHLGRALPAGVFSHAPLQAALQRLLSAPGRSNDFRELKKRQCHLVLVATDLDSGEAAPFGLPGWDHVPIAQAAAASAALPGMFPPVPINGRWYVDGALKKTLHASVLLDMKLDLVLCLNPLVPFDATRSARHRLLGGATKPIPRLVDGGLPVVMSQTFRSLIHSRLELGMKGYESSHPGTDIVLFEPSHRDPELFFANTFAYSQRRAIAEHAYQRTRADLRSRRSVLGQQLLRHGLALNNPVLDDSQRRLVCRRKAPRRAKALGGNDAARALRRLDEVLDDLGRALAARR
jgi:NTE family protein